MPTIETLKRRIQSTRDLQSVVTTMKTLAAVNIRQYERAVESLREYSKAVEMGLQVVLRNRSAFEIGAKPESSSLLGAMIIGTDQGMAGSLNERVASHALETMSSMGIATSDRLVLAVGERIVAILEDWGQPVEETFAVPSAVSGITPRVQQILVRVEDWSRERGLDRVLLFYSKQLSGALYRPHVVHLLPVEQKWLQELREQGWPTNMLPSFTMDWEPLFSALIREYLFISLYLALAESLASENASRLASMQGAERNIREQLQGLTRQYHQQRQMSITEELLDIVAGFEALTEDAIPSTIPSE